MSLKKIALFVLLLIFFTTPIAFAQQVPPDDPANNGDQDSCSSAEDSFEDLILVIHDTLEERRQERVSGPGGDNSKEPHLFLPPFQALPGIGSALPLSSSFVADLMPPIPALAPPIVEVDNPTLFGIDNVCETIDVSTDPN